MGKSSEPWLSVDLIWKKYLEGRDNGNGDEYRNLLIEHYRDLARTSAERMHAKLPPNVELDDLISDGILGLIGAIEEFDPSRCIKFETYCFARIKGAIRDGLRKEDFVNLHVRHKKNQVAKAADYLERTSGRKPTEEEMLDELRKDEYRDYDVEFCARKTGKQLDCDKKAKDILKRGRGVLNKSSLYTKRDKNNETSYEENPEFVGHKNQPYLRAQKAELKDVLLKGLTEAEKLIIVSYYYEEMTMKEIGKRIGVNESRVSQIHSSIISKLKDMLTSKSRRGRELLEDFVTA